MVLLDVDVLVYARRAGTPDHARYPNWLGDLLQSDAPHAVSDLVLSGFRDDARFPGLRWRHPLG